ncbi:hypothetical protein ABRY23_06865 [Melioribacteraceae bacterium 4301-Me]|uniref:hypothetical protein n=1 Tax=Pyranulibacter aquaticus TaxID=3163344 RepID=UPI003595DD25
MKKLILLVMFFSSLMFPQSYSNVGKYELLKLIKDAPLKEQSNFLKEEYTTQKKNAGLAILFSMIIPGMGELYADSYQSGIYFTVADGILWGVFAGFNLYGDWQKNNYRSFAQSFGSVNLDGKNSDYFATIGIYKDVYTYNQVQELNRNFDKVYDVNKFYWNWGTNEQRKKYREMWSSSETAYNNVRFAAGALILNRLISAINAVRAVSRYNNNLQKEASWNIYFGIDNKPTLPSSFTFNFTKHF